MARKPKKRTPPQFQVILGDCLGHRTYRGFGSLKDLSAISKADIFDQEKNPLGTQRNLSLQHARKAYRYVTERPKAFYPEIILNIRDASYISFKPKRSQSGIQCGTLEFVKDPRHTQATIVSRLDGNHRVWFADGHDKGLEAVSRQASVCFLLVPDILEELAIFRDINDNQMGMNTSHLQNITARLIGETAQKVQNPAAYIVQRLQRDRTSPLFQKMHEGGVKPGATLSGLTIANLTNAVRDMLSRSAKLAQFPDADAQFNVIENYWIAVKEWLPDAWNRPGDFIIFKGVGLYAVSYLGIEIIERCLLKAKFQPKDMLRYLKQIPEANLFASKGKLPYAGRAGGRRLASDLIANLEDEGEISLNKLQKMILGE